MSHSLKIILLFSFFICSAVKYCHAASLTWLPNVVHYINNSVPLPLPTPELDINNNDFVNSSTIDWASFGGEKYTYTLQYQIEDSDEWLTLYQGENSYFSFEEALSSGSYIFRVSCTGLEGCPSNQYVSTTLDIVQKPAYVNAFYRHDNENVEVNWGQLENVVGYSLEQSADAGESWQAMAPADGDGTSYNGDDFSGELHLSNNTVLKASEIAQGIQQAKIIKQKRITGKKALNVGSKQSKNYEVGASLQYRVKACTTPSCGNNAHSQSLNIVPLVPLISDPGFEQGQVQFTEKVGGLLTIDSNAPINQTKSLSISLSNYGFVQYEHSYGTEFAPILNGLTLAGSLKIKSISKDSRISVYPVAYYNESAQTPVGKNPMLIRVEGQKQEFGLEDIGKILTIDSQLWLNNEVSINRVYYVVRIVGEGQAELTLDEAQLYEGSGLAQTDPSLSSFLSDYDGAELRLNWPKFLPKYSSYQLEFKEEKSSSWNVLYSGIETEYNTGKASGNLFPTGVYKFRISCEGAGSCPNSGFVYATTVVAKEPAYISVKTNKNEASTIVNWANTVSAYGYVLEKSTTNGATWVEVSPKTNDPKKYYHALDGSYKGYIYTNSTTIIPGITKGNDLYRVKACRPNKCGGYKLSLAVYDHNEIPQSVTSFTTDKAQIEPGESVRLSWNRPLNYSGDFTYNLYVTKNVGDGYPAAPTFKWQSDIGVHSIIRGGEQGIQRVGTQVIEIEACNEFGCSDKVSVDITVDGPPPAPELFYSDKEVINAGDFILLSWAMSPDYHDSVKYNLYVEKPDGSPRYLFQEGVSVTEFNRTINMKGIHNFYIRACDAEWGCGDYSEGLSISVAVVYEDENGDLYTQLPSNYSGEYIKLFLDRTGKWKVEKLSISEWNRKLPQFSESNYEVEFGDFSGDEQGDLRLTKGNTTLILEQQQEEYVARFAAGSDISRPIGELTLSPSDIEDTLITELTAPATNDIVGSLQAKGRVIGGSVNYDIPVSIAPGRKGVQPSININYNSTQGNGLLGKGWSLSGLSNISRCSANWTENGYVDRVDLSDNDALCLDGKHLIVISGTYGDSESEYRTVNDSFAKVVLKGGKFNREASYFEVTNKDGSINYYGLNAASTLIPQGSTTPLKWSISRTYDNIDTQNSILYSYTNSNGEQVLDDIYYTGTGDTAGNRRVSFSYETRSDNGFSYINQASVQTTKRLTSISTYIGDDKLFDYSLVYQLQNSPITGHSLLESIEQCGYDNNIEQCLPKKEFSYSGDELSYNEVKSTDETFNTIFHGSPPWTVSAQLKGDFNNDGVLDFVQGDQLYLMSFENDTYTISGFVDLPFISYAPAAPYESAKLGQLDFDGDGQQDIIGVSTAGKLSIASLNNEQNDFTLESLGIDISCTIDRNFMLTGLGYEFYNLNLQPLNACRAEAISDGTGGYYLFHRSFNEDMYLSRIHKSCESNLCSTQKVADLYDVPVETTHYNEDPLDFQFIDFDGDGDPDIVRLEATSSETDAGVKLVWYRNDESGVGTATTNTFVKIEENIPSLYEKYAMSSGGHHWIDVNGDGLQDLLINSDDWYLLMNKGGNLGTPENTGIGKFQRSDPCFMNCGLDSPEQTTHSSIRIVDFNGDGLQDFMFLDRDVRPRNCFTDKNREYCQEGNGTETPSIHDIAISPLAYGKYSVYVSSLNENGDVSFDKQETEIQGSVNNFFTSDINSDGHLDLIGTISQHDGTISKDFQHIPTETFFYLGKSDSRGISPDLLIAAGDDTDVSSFGQLDTFEYQAYSRHKNATTGSTVVDNSDFIDEYHYRIPSTQTVAIEYNYKNVNGSTNTISYQYGDPIYHQAGLGFIGFESITEIDHKQGTTSNTTYNLNYPLNGKPDKLTVIETVDDSELTTIDYTWCDTLLSECDSAISGVFFVHLKNKTTTNFDPDGNSLNTKVVTFNEYDNYGNLLSTTSTVADADITHVTNIDNTFYGVDIENWWVNKLYTSTVTKSVSYADNAGIVFGTNNDKSITTTVTWKDNNQRQRATETITASDSELASITTYNSYDTYGNATKITRSGLADNNIEYTDVQSDQISEFNFDNSNGYFPNIEKNGVWSESAIIRTFDTRFGVISTETDVNGIQATTRYDAFGRVMSISSDLVPDLVNTYQWCLECTENAIFSITTVQDGMPTVEQYYNRTNQVLNKTTASFEFNNVNNEHTIETFTFDDLARPTARTFPHFSGGVRGSETYNDYDVLNRAGTKTVANNPQNYTVDYTYSGLNTAIVVDAGADGTRTMSRRINTLKQIMSTTDADSNTTHFRYDANGNAISITDVASQVISAQFNSLGHKLWFDDPNMGKWYFRYNALGQLRWQQDANITELMFDYDGLNRQTNRYVKMQSGTWQSDSAWIYDTVKKGLLTTEENSTARKTYGYDSLARINKETTQIHNQLTTRTFEMSFAYDTYYGRMKGMQYPSGELLAFEYDKFGYSKQDINPATTETYRQILSVNSYGKSASQQFGNGLYSHKEFSTSGEVTRICVNDDTQCSGTNSLDEIAYSEYDNFGNLKTKSDLVNSVSETYIYDNLHRIEQTTRSATGIVIPEFLPSASVNYDYDAAGNLTLKDDYANTYDYANGVSGGPNAVKSVTKLGGNTVNFAYDNNGNMTTGDGTILTYNAFNKPVSILKNSVTLAFGYGADDSRYAQNARYSDKTVNTYYLGKGYEHIETIAQGVTTVSKRHYLGDYAVLTYKDDIKTLEYLHRDRLGSVSLITQGYQTLADVTNMYTLFIERRGYDIYGKARDLFWGDGQQGKLLSSSTSRGFTDHEHLDDVELIHMNGRAFDYNLGRFLSVDPFIQMPENSQSLNPYSYLMNNPLAGTDPSGYVALFNRNTFDDLFDTPEIEEKIVDATVQVNGGIKNVETGKIGNGSTNQSGIGSEFIGAVKRIGQQILASQAESFWGNVGAENAAEIGIASGENIFPINNSAEQAGADIVDSSPALGIVIVAGQAIVTRGRSLDPNDLLRSHSISGKRSSERVDELSQNMRNEGFVGDGIDVVDNKGQLIIIDGHHRAAAARRTNTRVNVNVVTDIKNHPSNFNDINDVIKSAETVGLDQLKPRRR